MAEHYNLYYLFLEDMERHPMSEDAFWEIKKNIEKFYEKIKPPWPPQPPDIIGDHPTNNRR